LLDPELKDVIRKLLYKFSLHPVSVHPQALNKCVDSGGGLVIERIHELSGWYPPVWQFHILDRELADYALSSLCFR